MKDQLLALRSALEKLGYTYVRSTPGLTKDQVNLTFLPPAEPRKGDQPVAQPVAPTKPGVDRIAEVVHAIAEAGLIAGSLGIFKQTSGTAIVLQGLRIVAAAAEAKAEGGNLKPETGVRPSDLHTSGLIPHP